MLMAIRNFLLRVLGWFIGIIKPIDDNKLGILFGFDEFNDFCIRSVWVGIMSGKADLISKINAICPSELILIAKECLMSNYFLSYSNFIERLNKVLSPQELQNINVSNHHSSAALGENMKRVM